MVSVSTWASLAKVGQAAGGVGGADAASRGVASALGEGKYPWYDASADSFRPVLPPRELDFDWFSRSSVPGPAGLGSLGGAIPWVLAMLALAALLIVLFELWRRHRPVVALGGAGEDGRAARPARVEGLPEGIRPATGDPWEEALRLRERGDLAGATVCLFAHQLLTLDRLRLIRLAPGKTGRQLVATVTAPEWRGLVTPTLRLFETVYYGGRSPNPEAFEEVWRGAEAFERRAAEGVGA